MKLQVKQLMDENEMLSHIFLGCIPIDKLTEIKEKFIGNKDWEKEKVYIPVEMKIGGIDVNPQEFFREWKRQMNNIIEKEAKKLLDEKMGNDKFLNIYNKLNEFETILEDWESEINWEVKNPLL